MRRDDGRNSDDESEVVCMIRNNGSTIRNAIKEAARQSVLAGRKKKLKDYIRRFYSSNGGSNDVSTSTNSSSKRVLFQLGPESIIAAAAETGTRTSLDFPEFDCSIVDPRLRWCCHNGNQKACKLQPVQEEDLDELDVISSIDDNYSNGEFDWGDQGCGGGMLPAEYWY
ncbi:unnamed protein product [Linum trigynum]|uniref:Uncharacterized protein n=1 Tax=Linum trigynum TaxID=586398 RepID=A0AAV2D950_9ROSI